MPNEQNTMESKSKMKVEIWSDIACPFCYIGKKHYEQALESFDNSDDLELEWNSFLLDPTISDTEPIDMATYLQESKGMPASKVQEMFANIREMSEGTGIEFNFEKAVIASTRDAHRMLQLAKAEGLSNEAEEVLFKAYFTDGADLADLTVLKSLGLKVGLKELDLDRVLNSDDYSYEVNQDIREAANIGVQGVPFFVFNRRYGISGAQPVQAFIDTLNKAYNEWLGQQP